MSEILREVSPGAKLGEHSVGGVVGASSGTNEASVSVRSQAPDTDCVLFLGYEQHPAAAMYPLLQGEVFEALCESIRAIGLASPVVLHDGKVLEGRNRCRAIERLRAEGYEVEARFTEWHPQGNESPHDYVIAANSHRRQLTPDQHAAAACKYLPVLREESRLRQEASRFRAGRAVGGNTADTKSDPPRKRTSRDKNANSTAGQLAVKFGISKYLADQAIALDKAVRDGDLPTSAIEEVINGTKISKVLGRITKKEQQPQRRSSKRQEPAINTTSAEDATKPMKRSVAVPINPANLWGKPLPTKPVIPEPVSANENEERNLVSTGGCEAQLEHLWNRFLAECEAAKLPNVREFVARKLAGSPSVSTGGVTRPRARRAKPEAASIEA